MDCDCFVVGKEGYKKEIRGDRGRPGNPKERRMQNMRLQLILPVVDPEQFDEPKHCSDPKCKGKRFLPWQEVKKNVRDSEYEEVIARRYRCLSCGRTFRVYPQGVQAGQISQRLKGMGVMLYLLGLSYGAVQLMLEALGVYMSKSSVYRTVQTTAEAVPGMKRTQLMQGYQTCVLGADLTSVKCKGQWLPMGVVVDPINGLVLSIDQLEGEDAETLKKWIEPIADQVGAHTLVTDDADAFKQVADEAGLDHQICKSHVVRNTEELIASLSLAIEAGQDRSLTELPVEPAQALLDLRRLGELIHSRQPEQQTEVQGLYERYAAAPAPKPGRTASIAYRMRNLFLDRWNLWPRLTFYRTWKDRNGKPILDGTNNADERAIGWWVKERYRSMRGYKRKRSALNLSRLIAHCGNHLSQGLNLATLVA
jgi:transposase-like protein